MILWPVDLEVWYFGAFGVRGFERSVLGFAGIKPIRENLYGLAFADETKRARWRSEARAPTGPRRAGSCG